MLQGEIVKKRRYSDEVSGNFVRKNMKNRLGSCKSLQKGSKTKRRDLFVHRRDNSKETVVHDYVSEIFDNTLTTSDSTDMAGITLEEVVKHSDSFVSEFPTFAGIDCLDHAVSYLQETPKINMQNMTSNMPKLGSVELIEEIWRQIEKSEMKSNKFLVLPDQILTQYAPKCSIHTAPAKVCVVKKSNHNKGRLFYCCSVFPREVSCNYFCWIEDNPLLLQFMNQDTYNTSGSLQSMLIKRTVEVIRNYRDLLMNDTSLEEIRQVVMKNWNQRRQVAKRLNAEDLWFDSSLVKISLSGSKKEIVDRLMKDCIAYFIWKYGDIERSDCSNIDEDDVVDDSIGNNLINNSNECESDSEFITLSDSDDDEVQNVVLEKPVVPGSVTTATTVQPGSLLIQNTMLLDRYQMSYMNSNRGADDDSAYAALQYVFGCTTFRMGQKWAIDRVLRGSKSLLVLPTGAGKSLCYMLPSVLLPGITLVITPLISLMMDQHKKLPLDVPGYCFVGSALSASRAAALIVDILRGVVKVLFVAPERICTQGFHKFIELLRCSWNETYKTTTVNPISLVCIDEAHCISQWSYNFRSSYMRLWNEVQMLNPYSLLLMTATATAEVQDEIKDMFGIATDGVFSVEPFRDNLKLKSVLVRNSEEKQKALIQLLQSDMQDDAGKKVHKPCTIVYCWRRAEVDQLFEFLKALRPLTTTANDNTVFDERVVRYHSGLTADQRQNAQNLFLRGTARIILATIAFGMGIDKADIYRVIHLTLPKSIEDYLQEIGRAGRDGSRAECVLVTDPSEVSTFACMSLSNHGSILQIYALLCMIFSVESVMYLENNECLLRLQRVVGLDLQLIEKKVGLSSVVINTLLAMLEQYKLNNDCEFMPCRAVDVMVKKGQMHQDCIRGVVHSKCLISALEKFSVLRILLVTIVSCNELTVHSGIFPKEDTVHSYFESIKEYQFCCSLVKLSSNMNCTVENVKRILYSLSSNANKEAVIDYAFNDPALLFIEVDAEWKISTTRLPVSSSPGLLLSDAVKGLANKLYERIYRADIHSENRVYQMSALANSLSQVNESEKCKLLEKCFANSKFEGGSTIGLSENDKECIKADVLKLCDDPVILENVENILHDIPKCSCGVRSEILQYLAVQMVKLFKGISHINPIYDGKYISGSFECLYEYVHSLLTSRERIS